MQLDFTGLNQIGAAADFDTAAKEKPQERTQLQREADQRAETLRNAADVYKRYQENIRATELLQAQVLKGIKAQKDIYSLFLKAAKALSLTISNREFYAQILKELPQYYPEALDATSTAPGA